MDLLNRYLQAVKFWLPKEQQDDIAAELQEDLQSRIDEQQQQLGRTLKDTEVAVVLKQSGRPMLVASRYRQQRSLIGPVLYPIYLFVLRMIALFYLLPWVVVFLGLMVFSHSYRMTHPWGTALVDAGTSLWSLGVAIFGVVTIVFTVLERTQAQSKWMEKWEPLKLPAVRDTRQIKRSASISEIIANLIMAGWLILARQVDPLWPGAMMTAGVHLVLAPAWQNIFWALLLVALANVVFAVVNLSRPYWTMTRALIRLALDVAGSGIFCWFVKVNVLVGLTAPNLTAAQSATIVGAINNGLARAYPLTVLICVLVVVIADLPRLVRMRTGRNMQNSRPHPARA